MYLSPMHNLYMQSLPTNLANANGASFIESAKLCNFFLSAGDEFVASSRTTASNALRWAKTLARVGLKLPRCRNHRGIHICLVQNERALQSAFVRRSEHSSLVSSTTRGPWEQLNLCTHTTESEATKKKNSSVTQTQVN